MVKAAIFDKDGVIILNSKLYFSQWQSLFQEFGKEITEEFHNKFISGRGAKENIRMHINQKITDAEAEKLIVKYFNFSLDLFKKHIKLVPGIRKFLDVLNHNEFPTALATSSRSASVKLLFDSYKLQPMFNTVIKVEDISRAKPDPEIFLTAAKKLNIDPKNCVVFEDSYSGVEAARKAGMKVVLVMTSHTQKEIPDVDLAIKDFSKITLQDLKMI